MNVVERRPERQVSWLNTQPHVAAMTNDMAARVGVVDGPRDPVGAEQAIVR